MHMGANQRLSKIQEKNFVGLPKKECPLILTKNYNFIQKPSKK
jgi:hypothetical protein